MAKIIGNTTTTPIGLTAELKAYTDEKLSKKSDVSHKHNDVYYTETEIDTKLSTINESITNIENGTTVVKNAQNAVSANSANESNHAVSADSATTATSATKATQDANGNVITSTYETKSAANAKLTEAKEYTDTVASGKANASHNHDDRYYTESEIDTKISAVNTSITNITSGTTVVKKAEHASTADSATTANSAETASNALTLGSTNEDTGSTTRPIYLNNGVAKAGSTYAGGTKVTLNGSNKGASTASFYAPTSAGTSGYVLTSAGTGAPTWSQTIPVANGGTGATSASDARANLGVYSTAEVDEALSEKASSSHKHDDIYDAKGSASNALNEAKEYTNTKTSGMATTTVVDSKISTHNSSASAHSDIRSLITTLTTKVNNFLDVDDTTTDQLSEVLTLINNNKGTLESLTSGKVNVSDIVDNLTTSSSTKVLSAKQGVAIKTLIDALQEAVNGKANSSHTHSISEVTNLQSTLNAKASQADLDELEEVVSGKANASHGHAISEITNLQTTLNGKASVDHKHTVSDITDLTATATELNYMDGVTSNVQTQLNNKASQTSLDSHTGNKTVHITAAERTSWNAIEGNAKAYTDEQISTVSGNLSTHANNANIHFTATERTKLSNIAEGANKTVVDTALSSSSTNPVQNKIINSAISTLNSTVSANTSSISANSTAINNLQTDVNDMQEITSAEIRTLFSAN